MPEPERIPAASSPGSEAHNTANALAPNSSAATGHHQPLSKWAYLELPLLVAASATIGFLTGMGLWSELHTHSIDFALWAICLGLAAYVLFDPAMEWLYAQLGSTRSEFPEGRKQAATAIAALATLLVSAFHHSLDISFEPEVSKVAMGLENPSGFGLALLVFVSVGAAAAVITHWWARGAKKQPPRAAHYGGWASVLVGVFVVGSALAFLAAKNRLTSPLWAVGVGIMGLLWFVGPGILGGLAINKQNKQKGEISPTRGIVFHLIVFSAGYVFLLLAVGKALEAAIPAAKDTIDSYIWLPIAALLGQNLGWALAPFFRRESADRVLGLATAPAAASAPVTNTEHLTSTGFAGAVVEMPRREDSAATAGAAAAVGADVVGTAIGAAAASHLPQHLPQPNVEHARNMLLKPSGDRLWATLGLLVSLASSAYAYHMGTLRRDPDITYNVVQYLQQDSGLRRDNIKVQSSDRIVTLTGNVDDEAAHQEALRKALAVRGVKQIVDEIHVAPPPIVTPPAGAQADAGGPDAGAEINANVSIGGASGKPAAESAAKSEPAKANGAKSPAVAKANAAKANAAKSDEAKADKPASHNPLTAVKNALTGSSGNSKSATAAKTTGATDTTTAETSTPKSSKNPFSLLKNKIKKPKTGTTN